MKNEDLHKELELIQDIIKRMADNSFKLKAWLLTVMGGVLALSKDILFVSKETSVNNYAVYGLISFLILLIILFWYLDGFFLRTEKLYRNLYQWVIQCRPVTEEYLFDLNTFKRTCKGKEKDIEAETDSILKVMFSKTLLPFYLLPLLFVLVIMFLVQNS